VDKSAQRIHPKGNLKKVIVFKSADQVHIYKCDDDFAEGTVVRMDQKSEDSEAEQA
jgi:hypothetical protein